MGHHIAYSGKTFRVPDEAVPDNSKSHNPTEFDIVPAWGPDLARVKSMVYAIVGLMQTEEWTPEVQRSVIGAFDTGNSAFRDTITAIRGLTVPAAMAHRAGIIRQLPTKVDEATGQVVPDQAAPIPILTGAEFGKVCGAPNMIVLAYLVVSEIAAVGQEVADIDPRFWAAFWFSWRGDGQEGKGFSCQDCPATTQKARNCGRKFNERGELDEAGAVAPWHVPAQPVEVVTVGQLNRRIVRVEPQGAVFASVAKAGRPMLPAYTFGKDDSGGLMFTCPVSAIPLGVWQIVALWRRCQLMGVLPKAGGLLDQPEIVQWAFPILEVEFERAGGGKGAGDIAALLAMSMLKGGG